MAAKPSLGELLEGIDPNRLSQPCKDHHLSEVALHITEWQCIAPFLRLTEVDDKEIRTKFPQELIAQNMAMLRKWREKRGCKATYQELAKVFWKLEKLSLVAVLCEVLNDEYFSSESEGESKQGCVEKLHSHRWTVPRYASYLKGRYHTTQPPSLSLLWPPPPTYKVFNLTLIQKQKLEFGPNEELVRLLQRGQVKEAAESHNEIELSGIMRAGNKQRKVILIEGAPGSGKSTLAWHICQQWEKQELFTEYEVVVFVQLRDLKVQSATTVADILPVPSQEMGTTIASLLTGDNRWGKGVLLVLDGWDELQPDCPAHSLLMQLVQIPDCLNMHFSSLIITSRPVSSGELQPHASSRVEVLGFKSEDVQKYFKACFAGDHHLHASFVTQLKERQVMEASCFLPLNALIVVHTFLASNYSLPHTLHELFEKLVLSCIFRHVIERDDSEDEITALSLSQLPRDIRIPLSALCSLAFHGIWVNKVVFSETDLKIFKLPVDLSNTLSLIQVVESFRLYRRSKSYNFFHLQIQELLAAYYISKLEEDDQVRIFKDLFGQPRFDAVFQFYAAFTKLQAKGIREVLVDVLKRGHFDKVVHCVYEAQDPALCQLIGWVLVTLQESNYDEKPLFLSSSHNPLYMIAMGYFLCHYCYYCSEELLVSVHNVDIVNIQLLIREFVHHQNIIALPQSQDHIYGSLALRLTVSVGQYWENFVKCSSQLLRSLQPFVTRLLIALLDKTALDKLSNASTLCRLVKNCSSLYSLELLSCIESSVDELDLLTFFHSIHANRKLESLMIRNMKLHFSLKAVCSSMVTKTSMKYLIVKDCQFHLKDPARPLVHAIQISNYLKVLDLTGTSLHGCVFPLLIGLSSNTSVVELILKGCKVDLTGENGQALGTMLKTNIALKALNLDGSRHQLYRKGGVYGTRCVHAVDVQSICVGLTLNTSLAYLDLSSCAWKVTEESGIALVHMLQTNSALKSLKLDHNPGVSNEGALYLATGLVQNRGLEILSLVGCGISTAVVEVAKALEVNDCLLSLDISGNNIGKQFSHIVRSLCVNSSLRDLSVSECGIEVVPDIVGSTLESLDLSYNPIADNGTLHIAHLMTKSRSLHQLNLRACDIGDRGVEYLASALEVNTSLEILHIPANIFTDMGLLTLGRSVKMNKALKTLNVEYCATYTVVGLRQFVLNLCENNQLAYLGLSYEDKVKDEVSKVNQIRQSKNYNVLKVCSMFVY